MNDKIVNGTLITEGRMLSSREIRERTERRERRCRTGNCDKHENMIIKWDRSVEIDKCPVCKLFDEIVELNKKIKSLEVAQQIEMSKRL